MDGWDIFILACLALNSHSAYVQYNAGRTNSALFSGLLAGLCIWMLVT